MILINEYSNKLTVINQFEELDNIKASLLLDDAEDLRGSGGDDWLEVSRPVVPLFHVHWNEM